MSNFSKISILFVIIGLLLLAAPMVLAQDPAQSPIPTPTSGEQPPALQLPDKLPATAQEGLGQAVLLLSALGGVVASQVTDWIKKIPWLKSGEQEKIAGWLAFIITGAISILSGVALDRGMEYAVKLDTSGIWQVVLTFGPWVFAELRYRVKTFNAAA